MKGKEYLEENIIIERPLHGVRNGQYKIKLKIKICRTANE